MANIPTGTRHQFQIPVTPEISIDFMGIPDARVLATPFLIWNLEMAARDAIKPLLDDGFDSVGTEVNVKHLAATPLGMNATFRAEVVHVDGNRVRFKVEAFDDAEPISEGTHERYIVNVARFAGRVQAKRSS